MRNHEKKYEYGITENSYESPKELKSKIQRKDKKKKKKSISQSTKGNGKYHSKT